MKLLVFLFLASGLYLLFTLGTVSVYRPAAAVLRRRAPKPLTQTQIAVSKLAALIRPHIDMEPIQRERLAETLVNLSRPESPEDFKANALARALLLSAALLWTPLLNPVFGAAAVLTVCFALYSQEEKKLQKEMGVRRQRIERELPQFASTIRQCLNSTHDVVAVLETYRKVCGPVLRAEIDHTLNDMVTGNPERALKALEGRVASPQLGQLTRGLVSVLRGDDQRLYFDMLSTEYRKAQNEEVAKALLKRPEQLSIYMGLLFVCIILMIAASLGTYLAQQMGAFF